MRTLFGIGFLFLFLLSASISRAEFLLIYDAEYSESVFRVNTETGEAYSMSQVNKGVHRWVKIEESERIERAAYRFAAVTDKGVTRLMRIDPVSGSSWVTSGQRWKTVLEP